MESADADETTSSLRSITATLSADRAETLGGGQVNMRLTLVNSGKKPVPLVLEGEQPAAGAHYDWSLLTGISPPKAVASEGFKVRFAVKTSDGRDVNVDQLRLVPPSAPPPMRLYRVILAPQAQLTHAFIWLALGIPAPYPPFEDDAGHRIVPKTSPKPLSPGKYTVSVDVPYRGAPAPQRIVSTQVTVIGGS